ncbi:hypothetical protein [Wenxinia saemankumensis]|uniref:Uncharacterized protein n=1 Tax=Wenxinia saemankumensis TaxID=1447782 RepID=A0A1M6A033_9RHOB|nr:hypothetical protein [Wenxinia saemankumensis]SHI29798.1 hypothetical protein SAMN05444417_0116 [Wenxinia saemankumensis]
MWRAIKLIFWLVVLAAIALLAYAYIGPVFFPGDFEPPLREMRQPVTLGQD